MTIFDGIVIFIISVPRKIVKLVLLAGLGAIIPKGPQFSYTVHLLTYTSDMGTRFGASVPGGHFNFVCTRVCGHTMEN